MVLTFNFINLSWVFFRAEQWEDAIKIIKGMFGFSGILIPSIMQNYPFLNSSNLMFGEVYINFNSDTEITLWLFFAFFITLFLRNSNQILRTFETNNKTLVFIVLMFLISLMHLDKNVDFIYFNF